MYHCLFQCLHLQKKKKKKSPFYRAVGRIVCYMPCLVARSCPTLRNPLNCSLPSSFVHGIFQARILEWVAIFLLQGIFLTQGSNTHLLYWQVGSLPAEPLGNLLGGIDEFMHTVCLLYSWLLVDDDDGYDGDLLSNTLLTSLPAFAC